jgi:polyhydroxyalkanoate synthesis regulator phasin
MATNDVFKRLFDAGLSFTQMTQAKAEDIVREMQQSGQLRVEDVQSTVQELIDRGRESTENLVHIVQREVSKQLEAFGIDFRDLEKRVEELAARLRNLGPTKKAAAKQPSPAKAAAAPAAPAKKKAAATKKKAAPAKKKAAATKKTATSTKKAAKKATKKTSAKKSGSS